MMPGVVMGVLLHPRRTPVMRLTAMHDVDLVRRRRHEDRLQHDDAERLAMRGRRLCCDDRAAPTEAATSGAACGTCCRFLQPCRRRDGYFSAERWKITIEGNLHDFWHRLFGSHDAASRLHRVQGAAICKSLGSPGQLMERTRSEAAGLPAGSCKQQRV